MTVFEPVPEYLSRLLLAQLKGHVPAFVGVAEASIRHDAVCAHLMTNGVCDCDPTIEIRVRDEVIEVLRNGLVRIHPVN